MTNGHKTADHGRSLLRLLLVWAIVSVALLQWLQVPHGHGANILQLELARDATAFEHALAGWREDRELVCGMGAQPAATGGGFGTLRCQLFFDSIGLVPAYVGLLLFFSLALGRAAGMHGTVLRHGLCAPAVAAGLFDIAENGMTGRALEDFLLVVLADATVRDVMTASLGKWALLALAFALLAALALAAARRGRTSPGGRPGWLVAAAALGGVAALLLALGTWRAEAALLGWGMRAAVLALALLSAWRWRHGPIEPSGRRR